ncbi:hypothetical protein P9112_004803 [Eukaryota sp. TZLM1-RC]
MFLRRALESSVKAVVDFYNTELTDFSSNLRDTLEDSEFITRDEVTLPYSESVALSRHAESDNTLVATVQKELSTFDPPLDSSSFKSFCETFPIDDVLRNSESILNSAPPLLKSYDSLVIRGDLSEEQFFLRYFYTLNNLNLSQRKNLQTIESDNEEEQSCEGLFSDEPLSNSVEVASSLQGQQTTSSPSDESDIEDPSSLFS